MSITLVVCMFYTRGLRKFNIPQYFVCPQMLLYILLDLNRSAWISSQDPLNNIRVFINAFLISSPSNVVRIVNSSSVIYDSDISFEFSPIISLPHSKISPADLGFALMDSPDAVLLFDFSPINPSHYLSFLKAMFVAQNRQIPIHVFSRTRNTLLQMCSESSGGIFLNDCSLSELFRILGTPPQIKPGHPIRCSCCNNSVTLGYVCPVCLSVFCKFLPICKRCKTKFSFPT